MKRNTFRRATALTLTALMVFGTFMLTGCGKSYEHIFGDVEWMSNNKKKASDPDMMILDDESKKTVREVFAEKAREVGCDITFVKSGNTSSRYENGKMIFTFGDETTEYETSLFGDHQIQNAAAAITCARKLGISEDTIAEGISRAVWKGRTELILQDPPVMLDGGHNDQGARSLALTLGKACGKVFVKRKVRLLMGVMGDKDYEGIIRELREAA